MARCAAARRPRVLLTCVVVGAAVIAGCSPFHPAAAEPGRTATFAAHPRCSRAATAAPAVRHLRSSSGRVWVWIESSARPSVRVGALVKVVWRITGTGGPRVRLSNPQGRRARLAFGPERHPLSTFVHPGAEYGTGFTPDRPGCWQMTMRRGDVTASLPFRVVS